MRGSPISTVGLDSGVGRRVDDLLALQEGRGPFGPKPKHPPAGRPGDRMAVFDPTYPFLAVLLVYMLYSQWARLDSRYLVGAALLLLVVTAVVDAAGAASDANVLAVYVFYLLGGGVLLLLIDHVREERARSRAPAAGGKKGPASPSAKTPTGAEETAASASPSSTTTEPTPSEPTGSERTAASEGPSPKTAPTG